MVDRVEGLLARISEEMQRKEMTTVSDSGGGRADGFLAYELVDDRPGAGDGSQVHRWRVVVDSATGLPQRLEYFSRERGENEWQLFSYKEFEYLTERDMASALATMFPDR